MKGEPKLSDGHKQEKHVVREGMWDPRVLDSGPVPDPDRLRPMPFQPEPLPHPVLDGYAAKGASRLPERDEKRERFQRQAASRRRGDFW